MKITTAKIIRELEKKGYGSNFLNGDLVHALIANTRNVIDEILKEQKGLTIKK
jgi:hypothetical protein